MYIHIKDNSTPQRSTDVLTFHEKYITVTDVLEKKRLSKEKYCLVNEHGVRMRNSDNLDTGREYTVRRNVKKY